MTARTRPTRHLLLALCLFVSLGAGVTGCGADNASQESPTDVGAKPTKAHTSAEMLRASDVVAVLDAERLRPQTLKPFSIGVGVVAFDNAGEVDTFRGQYGDGQEKPPAICNLAYLGFIGAQRDTNSAAIQSALEAECRRRGMVAVDFVASTLRRFGKDVDPNCCDPEHPKPASVSGAVVVGAGGGRPSQATIGTASVLLFPDAASLRAYRDWLRLATESHEAGEFVYPHAVCNAVVEAGSQISYPEEHVSRDRVVAIAAKLAEQCGADGSSIDALTPEADAVDVKREVVARTCKPNKSVAIGEKEMWSLESRGVECSDALRIAVGWAESRECPLRACTIEGFNCAHLGEREHPGYEEERLSYCTRKNGPKELQVSFSYVEPDIQEKAVRCAKGDFSACPR